MNGLIIHCVGVHLCVYPSNAYENIMLNIQSKGQTRGSAPMGGVI